MAFDVNHESNATDELAEKEIEEIIKKIATAKKFYEDLDELEVESEMKRVLRLVYDNEKSQETLQEAAKQKHIIDQWTYLRNRIPFFSEHEYIIFFRLMKRSALGPNAQSGCERANSIYNLFKTKLSVSMKLPMIRARLRIKTNGPPLSMFNPKPVRVLWLKKGHEYAETATKNKIVINQIRKKNSENYTSKIFD